MLHELDQPTVIEIIEGHHDTLPTSRTYLSTSGLLARSTRSTGEHWRFLGDGRYQSFVIFHLQGGAGNSCW